MDKIEQLICQTIDAHKDEIIAFGRDIWHHAELGYQEVRTSKKFSDKLTSLGIQNQTGLAITGVKGYLKDPQKTSGPVIALQGEMDALPMSKHKDANPETGAAHCCGHHAQLTGVFGAAIALTIPEVRDALNGNIVFMGVPAEENVDRAYRKKLMEEGKIRYSGGKCELIRIGAYDDIDMCIDNHSGPDAGPNISNGANNGYVIKIVQFHGISSHSAATPFMGCDAQAAAIIAMHAVDAQRESFRDRDHVRIHGYIVSGGQSTNTIADEVVLEYMIRASSTEGIKLAASKFDRAMKAGAIATGCGMTIETELGYLPRYPAGNLDIFEEIFETVHGEYPYQVDRNKLQPSAASSDEGDVSSLLPLYIFHTGGVKGQLHNVNLEVVDEYHLYILTAKIFAISAYRFLKDGAAEAKKVIDAFHPLMTKEEYLALREKSSAITELPMEPIVCGR